MLVTLGHPKWPSLGRGWPGSGGLLIPEGAQPTSESGPGPAPELGGCCDPADIEEKGVRMKLTVIDTPGFGDHINNENW